MTPIGIWRIVNATLNAVMDPVGKARREARRDDEGELRHAETDRARRHQRQRLAGLRRRAASTRAGSGSRSSRSAGTWMSMCSSDPATTPTASASTPIDGRQEHGGADDREVVDDRRQRRRGEPVLRVEDARRDRAQREEDRAQQHDPRQLDGLVERGLVEARA